LGPFSFGLRVRSNVAAAEPANVHSNSSFNDLQNSIQLIVVGLVPLQLAQPFDASPSSNAVELGNI
jgi:hypothetical protein